MIFLDFVFGSPPAGVNVTLTVIFAVPVRWRLRFVVAFVRRVRVTLPGLLTDLVSFLTPFPARRSVPAPGTVAMRVELPARLPRFGRERVNELAGFRVDGRRAQ